MKTLILSSSLSKRSRSFILCHEVLKILSSEGVNCTIVDARNMKIQPTHNEITDEMKALAKQIEETDNIIIGKVIWTNNSFNIKMTVIFLAWLCINDTRSSSTCCYWIRGAK